MTTPDTDDKLRSPFSAGGTEGDGLAAIHPPPKTPPIPPNAKDHGIHVSPAVLEAAGKDGEELLRYLRTSPAGLTQTEAEERLRSAGPNQVTQEHRQGWLIRLLKIIRNPLVILLAILSSISFATGDARAGTVMAAMVLLSVTLRFLQEARADAAAAKLKGWSGEGNAAPRVGARGHHQPLCRRHDPGRRARDRFQRPFRQPG
jgi:P-type Mg2+ transporter